MAASKDFSMYDPELAAIISAFPDLPPFTREILPALRKEYDIPVETILAAAELTHEEVTIQGPESKLTLSIFRPKASSSQAGRPGIFHIHGGGMIIMNRFAGIETLAPTIIDCDAVLVTIEYRLAPEHPSPAQLDDCYAGLVWMFQHAKELGVDPTRIMIAGASAGGNLSAGVALMARDRRGPRLCAQVLMGPMLDDTNSSHSTKQLGDTGTWKKHMNEVAWKWYLDGKQPNKYTAPARCTDLAGLPPTFIDMGALEIFRDEGIAFAATLLAAGVSTELHVWPGAYHAFELIAPQAAYSKHAANTRGHWMKKIFDQGKPKL